MTRLPGDRLDHRRAVSDVDDTDGPRVGVLALQGDVLEHARALRAVGLNPLPVRAVSELDGVAGIVLPGGESTAISRALVRAELLQPLAARIAAGMPTFGTCAGLILLSDELSDGDDPMPRPRGLAVRTRRNAYGSQSASFDARFAVDGVAGEPMEASFIRAPRIEAVLHDRVRVLASVDGVAVAVQQGSIFGLSFHPEVAADYRLHALFAATVRSGAGR